MISRVVYDAGNAGGWRWEVRDDSLPKPLVARGVAGSEQEARAQADVAGRAIDGDVSGWTADDNRRFIASQRWVFAKTMPENPHEYCVLEWCDRQHELLAMREWIRQHGVRRQWQGGWVWFDWTDDGWTYWVGESDPMPDGDTWDIINRKRA